MRTFLSNTCLLFLFAILAGCNPIDKDDYLIYVEHAPVGRAVLVEDFTGQQCVNCPEATDVIEQLVKDYGEENIVAVGIHSMPLGFAGNSKNIGLMNDEGKAYGEYWNVESQPCGLINRSGGLKDRSEWPTIVHNQIQKTAPLELKLLSEFSADDKALEIQVGITALKNIDAKLQLWIVEDGIVAMQRMPDGSLNREYVHNHVFRAAVNGLWGDDLNMSDGEMDAKTYHFTLAEDLVPENCSIVAFAYNESEGVLQVSKIPITKK